MSPEGKGQRNQMFHEEQLYTEMAENYFCEENWKQDSGKQDGYEVPNNQTTELAP